jgi:ubiquitin-protein ligase
MRFFVIFREDFCRTEEHIITFMAFTPRLLREFKKIKSDGRLDETIQIVSAHIDHWHATLFGVKDTDWADAVPDLEFVFSSQYRNEARNVHVIGTIAFQPIVYTNGKMCFNALQYTHSSVSRIQMHQQITRRPSCMSSHISNSYTASEAVLNLVGIGRNEEILRIVIL